MYNNKITGKVIRRLRLKKGLSQEVLSGFACIQRSHLAMIEGGTINPTVDTLWRISEALGIRLSKLFEMIELETDSEADTRCLAPTSLSKTVSHKAPDKCRRP